MSTPASRGTSVGALANVSYDPRAADFIRFRDDPNDDVVASIARTVALTDEAQRDRFRSALDESTTDTLRLYAMRQTLRGRRRSSLNLVNDALSAFALLPTLESVPWDTWVKGALFGARFLGRDAESLRHDFHDVASGDAGARFDIALESMNRVESLDQCHLTEVTTDHGTGFVETLVFKDTSWSGLWNSAPRAGVNVILYQPTTNLAQLASTLADAFDATGTFKTGPIGQDQLAGSLFSMTVPGSYLTTAGCLSFYAALADGSSLTAFVAEMPAGTDMDEFQSDEPVDDQVLVIHDERLVLLLAQPRFDDVELDVNLDDHVDLARRALEESAPARWIAQ